MAQPSPAETLEAFAEKAFARHLLYDLPFPFGGTVALVLLLSWLMLGKVPHAAIAGWVLLVVAAVLARALFVRHMKTRVSQGRGHTATLRGLALLSLPIGACSGVFAWLYFDALQPMTVVILGTYMTVVIVGGLIPSAVYLPCFYLLVLSSHIPYLALLLLSDSPDHLVVAGINVLFLIVSFSYAHAAHQLHRQSIRLRFENQHLIASLELRNREVELASRDKSLFLAGVSHDLKQPIRAIAMYTGFLRHSALPDEAHRQVQKTTEKIDAALSEIHQQISRLLELSRLESGALPLKTEALALEQVLEQIMASLAPEAAARGVHLRLARMRPHEIWADRRMLESILNNLVSNAIKHAGGGRVYVGTRRSSSLETGPRLCIEVRDNGVGIAPHQLPLLFDAYRSFDDRHASESHGLGLAIASAQAAYLGGDITVRSQPGCGATFTLRGLRCAAPTGDGTYEGASPEKRA